MKVIIYWHVHSTCPYYNYKIQLFDLVLIFSRQKLEENVATCTLNTIQEIKRKSRGQAAKSVLFSLSLWLQRSNIFPQALTIDLNTIQNGNEEFYGIIGKANNLIKSYLQNRYQRVQIKKDLLNYCSDWELITDGVPQGSILGPLFFLLYINDLPNTISDLATPILFADDTSLIISNPDSSQFEKDINTVIQTLNRWFHSNLLFLNFEKTHFLQFLTTNTNVTKLHLTYDNTQISNIEHSKFLGLMINNRLTWQNHIDLMIPKLNSATYVIRSLKPLLNIETLKKVYFSFAHSILSYGIIFWGISNYSKIIFKIQKE